MSRLSHLLALFSLFPYRENERVTCAVSYPDNIRHVLTLSDSIKTLNVGFHIRGKSSITLVILERGVKADIYVKRSSIAKI